MDEVRKVRVGSSLVHGLRKEYGLRIWQQPSRARLCSFKEENDTIDRRPVDPPPVVELQSFNTDLTELLESTSFLIRASIVHLYPTPGGDDSHFPPAKTPSGADATAGETIQTPEQLNGLDGRPGAVVVFAKLSVRVPGIFRLKFTLYETSDEGICEVCHIVSEPFEVFSPKLFRGMKESTALTRHLAGQGLKIKLRTDTTVGRQSDSRKRRSAQAQSSSASPTRAHSKPFPSDRSLVWRPSDSRLHLRSPSRGGDDGMIPTSFRDLAARFDRPLGIQYCHDTLFSRVSIEPSSYLTASMPSADLSSFSLGGLAGPSSSSSHRSPGLPLSSAYVGNPSLPSLVTQTSSARSESPSMPPPPPLLRRLELGPGEYRTSLLSSNIGPGDDGFPLLSRLPPLRSGDPSPPPRLPPIRSPFLDHGNEVRLPRQSRQSSS